MSVFFVCTSGLSIHLCKGILWLFWNVNREILLCLSQLYLLIVQHLEWLITTKDVVKMLILVLILVGNMSKHLFHRWLLNLPLWIVCVKPCGIHQTLKWGIWLVEHVGVVLSSMLCPNMGLSWSIKAQKSSLDWCCYLFFTRYCWMRSTTLSCLLVLGLKSYMLCCLLVCGSHRWEFLVSNIKFANVLKIEYKHPRLTGTSTHCWQKVWILVNGFYHWAAFLCKWL